MSSTISLATAAEAAVRTCLANPSLVLGTGETAEVARLVLHLPDALVNAWKPFMSAGELDVLGVFSHKTPKTRWVDPRTKETQSPELCDLLLVIDSTSAQGRARRALVVQAKPASSGSSGKFSVSKGSPEVQRYLYTHWPKFTLTGSGGSSITAFDIAPLAVGTCPGTRYACVNVGANPPASGWWVEGKQAHATKEGSYSGTFQATVPLGEALSDMVGGKLGAALTSDSDWKKLVEQLETVAENRQLLGKNLSDVVATASGTVLNHVKAASLFMTDASRFFDSKATCGHSYWGDDALGSGAIPPNGERPAVIVEEEGVGFGVIYVRLILPEWRIDE